MSTAGIWLYKHLNDKVCQRLPIGTLSVSSGVIDGCLNFVRDRMTCRAAPVGEFNCFLRAHIGGSTAEYEPAQGSALVQLCC